MPIGSLSGLNETPIEKKDIDINVFRFVINFIDSMSLPENQGVGNVRVQADRYTSGSP
jgi:hypothetical protein